MDDAIRIRNSIGGAGAYMAGVLLLIKVSLENNRVGIMQDRERWSGGGGRLLMSEVPLNSDIWVRNILGCASVGIRVLRLAPER